jgi:hypothetical protein
MESPNGRRSRVPQKVKKNWIVEIIAMQIVQMDDIKTLIPEKVNQLPRGMCGAQSVSVEQEASQAMDINIPGGANPVELGCTSPGPPAVSDPTLMSMLKQNPADPFGNSPGAPGVGNSVNLNNSHAIRLNTLFPRTLPGPSKTL